MVTQTAEEFLAELKELESINNNSNRERLQTLLHSLSLGKLNREHAIELKPLLLTEIEKARSKGDIERDADLSNEWSSRSISRA